MTDKLKILVLSSIPPPNGAVDKDGNHIPDWADLSKLTCATHQAYCEKNGYEYRLDISDIWEPEKPTHRGQPQGPPSPIKYAIKFRLFQHYLDPDACREEWDHVVWLDSDLVITNYNIPLERFLNSKPGTDDDVPQYGDIILTRDPNGLHGTVIMMRRSGLTLGFAWANANAGDTLYRGHDWSDMMSSRFFLQTPPYQELVHYHSVKTLCAMPPNMYPIPRRAVRFYEWEEGCFALHLSALSIPKRIEIAKEYCERLNLL